MDLEDNSVCDTPGPPVFILPASQQESQLGSSENEDVMREMLRKLPALQSPRPQGSTASGRGPAILLDEPSTEESVMKAQAPVLVSDSEYETTHKPAYAGDNDPSDVVSESEDVSDCRAEVTVIERKIQTAEAPVLVSDSEYETTHKPVYAGDNGPSDVVSESEDVSDSRAEVTVIETKIQTDSDIIADTEPEDQGGGEHSSEPAPKPSTPGSSSTPSNESSPTRVPVAHSFQSKDRSNLGSYDQCELYTTQQAHAHGSRFNIFPSSQEDMFQDQRGVAGGADSDGHVSTPSEYIGSLQFSGAPMLVAETVDETENEIPPSPDVYGSTPLIIPGSPTDMETQDEEDDMYDVNAVDTLADSSKDSSDISEGAADEIQPTGDDMEADDCERNGGGVVASVVTEQMLQVDIQAALDVPTLVDDNIAVIKVASQPLVADVEEAGAQSPDRQSESLRLYLSESHPDGSGLPPQVSDMSHGQLEVSPETEKGPPVLELVPETPKKRPHTAANNKERAVEDIDAGGTVHTPHVVGSVEIVSQHSVHGIDDVIVINSNSHDDEDECEDLLLHLSPSQITSQSGRSRFTRSQRDPAAGHGQTDHNASDVKSSKSSSNDGFSGMFHLTLPKDGTLLHPVQDVSMPTKDTEVAMETNREQLEPAIGQDETSDISDPRSPSHSPTLTLGMIQPESEPPTLQPQFRLERPAVVAVTTESPEVETDMFHRASVQPVRPHHRYVIDDGSDDDDYLTIKPRTIAPPGDIDVTKGDDSRSPTPGELRITEHVTEAEQAQSRSQGHVEQPRSQGPVVDVEQHQITKSQKNANIEESVEDTLPYDPKAISSLHQNGLADHPPVDYRKDVMEPLLPEGFERQLKRPETPRCRRDSGDSVSSHGSISKQISMERNSPKSPKEIQHIIKMYSHILSKGKYAKSVEQRRGSEDTPTKSQTGSTKLSPKKHDSQTVERRGSQSTESKFVTKLARSLSISSQPELSRSSSVDHRRPSHTDSQSMAVVHRSASVDHRRVSHVVQKHDSQTVGKLPKPVIIETSLAVEDLQRHGSEHKISNVEHQKIPEDVPSNVVLSSTSRSTELQAGSVTNIAANMADTQPPVGSPAAKSGMWMSARKPAAIPSDISDVTGSEVATQTASPVCTQPGGRTGLSQDIAAIVGTELRVSVCNIRSHMHGQTDILDDHYDADASLEFSGMVAEAGHPRNDEVRVLTRSSRASSVTPHSQSIVSPTHLQPRTTSVTFSSRPDHGTTGIAKLPPHQHQTLSKTPNIAQTPVPYTDSSKQNENHNFSPVNNSKSGNPENRVTLTETSAIVLNAKPNDQKTVTTAISTRSAGRMATRSRKLRQKTRKLPSSAERNRLRGSRDCTPSPNSTSGSFLVSTQTFTGQAGTVEPQPGPGADATHMPSEHAGDQYTFHGSQSQVSPGNVGRGDNPRMKTTPVRTRLSGSSPDKIPLSSYKRKRLQHRKSGLKKTRVDKDGETMPQPTSKHHVWFKGANSPVSHDLPISQQTDVTSTTTGSLPSMPSSISQSSPLLDPVVSPSSSSSRHSGEVRESIRSRLSIDQSQPDTLPLHNSDDESYQKVTIVTRITKSYTVETKTEREVIGPQGQLLERNITNESGQPVVTEERTYKKMQVVYMPSPSRSITSLTSGDLADISSSLSRSSGSMGSKVSMTSASLESGVSGSLDVHTGSLDHSDSLTAKAGSVNRGRTPSTDTSGSDKIPEQPGPSHIEPRAITAEVRTATPVLTDQDSSGVITPLGSSINKTGSYLHSRTVSMESPKTSESLFSTPENTKNGKRKRRKSTQVDESAEELQTASVRRPSITCNISEPQPSTSKLPSSEKSSSHTSSSDQISPEIPPQVQTISSSSPDEGKDLVPSTGLPGSRVIARWKDGFYYPGMVKITADARNKCLVKFDDGDKMAVKVSHILLIDRLPVGQSVMVLTDNGDFESGMVLRQQACHYVVETDSGKTGRYQSGQVILTADQASCLITDQGRDIMMVVGLIHGPTHVGDVSLENLMEGPRRSATKSVPVKEDDKGQGSRGRKRKIDAIKPQYTSTPTPKGTKQEVVEKKRKAMAVEESPVGGFQTSPADARRSPRKAKVGLFGKPTAMLPCKEIFKGICFLLTNVDKSLEQRREERKLLKDSSLETSTDESTVEEEMAMPFDKDSLKSQIAAGGGLVINSINQKQVETSKKMFLISSTFQRTFKYLQCLAQGIPCMSHMWLVDSCTQGRLLDHRSYVLPAGINLERKRVMERKSSAGALVGQNAIVTSQTADFCEAWTNILQLSSCNVLPKLLYAQLDLIVTDSTCPATVVRQARSHAVPLVSSEWVIQSLVNGRPVKYDGHPRYQHDYVLPIC